MNIDLSKLNNNLENNIILDEKIDIPLDWLNNTDIKALKEVSFIGNISKSIDETYDLTGCLIGKMVLLDNVTLDKVDYPFNIEIEENIKKEENTLDILPYLWQNILVEVPLKVNGDSHKNINLQGNGWRLIKEEDLEKETDSPFKELDKLFEQGKE